MKFKPRKSVKTTVSDKIAEALTVKAKADIEDDQVFNTKPHTVSRADFSSSDSEDEAVISDFRKRNVNLLSEISKKYEGQVVSRKDLDQNISVSKSDFESDSDENAIESNFAKTSSTKGVDHLRDNGQTTSDSEAVASQSESESDDYSVTKVNKQSDSEESADEEGEDDEDGYDISQIEELPKEEFEHVKKQNVTEEAKKGNSVRNQLLLWEGLLEMRIHLQRCMNTANQMPMSDLFEDLQKDKEFAEQSNATQVNISHVLEKFLILQNILFKKIPETKSISLKKQITSDSESKKDIKDSDEEIPSDSENEEIPSDTEPEDNEENAQNLQEKSLDSKPTKKRKLNEYEDEISTTHKAFKTFRDSTIQKWNEKTKLATAANIKNTQTNTIIQQINFILSDRNKLIRRTQLKRSEYDIIGYEKPNEDKNNEENQVTKDRKDADEYIPEIFDDSDFYHQLLRELIECKSADISDPVQLSRQWIALQQMRSKMKRKVDTKATKGRKIKYVVHNQLVNYMAPEKSTTWNEESTNELYSSLFGKMFEQNNLGLNAVETNIKINN